MDEVQTISWLGTLGLKAKDLAALSEEELAGPSVILLMPDILRASGLKAGAIALVMKGVGALKEAEGTAPADPEPASDDEGEGKEAGEEAPLEEALSGESPITELRAFAAKQALAAKGSTKADLYAKIVAEMAQKMQPQAPPFSLAAAAPAAAAPAGEAADGSMLEVKLCGGDGPKIAVAVTPKMSLLELKDRICQAVGAKFSPDANPAARPRPCRRR